MKSNQSKIIESKSDINYPYATIQITQSRLDKGLLAIPISLAIECFPERSDKIGVYLGDSNLLEIKKYSSYKSSTREARIGGLAKWFKETGLKDGDEIVVQFIDESDFIYRLVPESDFVEKTLSLQKEFDKSKDEDDAIKKISEIEEWIKADTREVALNEYKRIVNQIPLKKRKRVSRSNVHVKETTPPNIRVLLEKLYLGHCQVCEFFFLKRSGRPYFEIHHIDPNSGHHPINLVLVCSNCHSQFTYAHLKEYFDDQGWLVKVRFNDRKYVLNQVRDNLSGLKNFKKLFVS